MDPNWMAAAVANANEGVLCVKPVNQSAEA